MKLWRIPNPWDYHEIAGYVIAADNAEEAIAKCRAWIEGREAKERERDAAVAAMRVEQPDLPQYGHQTAEAWAAYSAAHHVPTFEEFYHHGHGQYDRIEEVAGGVLELDGCDD